MQLVPGTDTHRPAAWYVGQQSWSLPWLPGRIVSTEVAAAALRAAETLQAGFPFDHPRWSEVHDAAQLLGLTARDLAVALGLGDRLPDDGAVQPQPDSAGMHWPQRDSVESPAFRPLRFWRRWISVHADAPQRGE